LWRLNPNGAGLVRGTSVKSSILSSRPRFLISSGMV